MLLNGADEYKRTEEIAEQGLWQPVVRGVTWLTNPVPRKSPSDIEMGPVGDSTKIWMGSKSGKGQKEE